MINGRDIALKNGGMRNGKLWKKASEYVLNFQSGKTWSRKIGATTAKKYFIEMLSVR